MISLILSNHEIKNQSNIHHHIYVLTRCGNPGMNQWKCKFSSNNEYWYILCSWIQLAPTIISPFDLTSIINNTEIYKIRFFSDVLTWLGMFYFEENVNLYNKDIKTINDNTHTWNPNNAAKAPILGFNAFEIHPFLRK